MGEYFEVYEKVDYGNVINTQLSRIARARSLLLEHKGNTLGLSTGLYNTLTYLNHVEALYTILLPSLRGDSGKYLDTARRLAYIIKKVKEIDIPGTCVDKDTDLWILLNYDLSDWGEEPSENEEDESCEKYLEEIKEYMNKLLSELPEDLRNKVKSSSFEHEGVVFIIDKALEEMITKLDSAGLLMRGKPIKVGKV